MGALLRLKRNLQDVATFGPAFLLRHLARLSGAATTQLNMPRVGKVHVRYGESDVASVREVFEGEYDLGADSLVTRRIERRYQAILDEGQTPVVVDAGANIGAASLWFCDRYPRAGIVAVEPEPGNSEILHKNLDGKPNFVVLDAAVGAQSGFVTIDNGISGWGARTTRADTGIPVLTIQQAIAAVPGGIPFIVKVDIEGFENELFAANIEWIADTYVVIIEPHDWMLTGQHSSRSFQKAMATHDFELFLSGENLIYVRI